MSEPRMILAPARPEVTAPRAALVDALQQAGALGAPAPRLHGMGFLAGERLFDLISFLGCSPRVDLDPSPDDSAPPTAGCVYWVIDEPSREARLVTGRNLAPPRCPDCRATIAAAPDRAAGGARAAITCSGCGRSQRLEALDWRRSAAVGRILVELRGIHPAEAVPGEALLQLLAGVTGTPWRYAYVVG